MLKSKEFLLLFSKLGLTEFPKKKKNFKNLVNYSSCMLKLFVCFHVNPSFMLCPKHSMLCVLIYW